MGVTALNLRNRWRCRALFSLLLLPFALAVAAAEDDHGIIYRASQGTTSVVLLGSVHMASAEFYPLRAAITAAFDNASALVVEVDVDSIDPQRLSTWLATYGTYPPGETLRDHLQPATWARLQAYLQGQHMDASALNQQRPGLVAVTLSATQMNGVGFSAALGIDEHFLERARTLHKPVLELESLEQQLTLLSDLPNPDLLINQCLDEATELPALIDELSAAWKQGDAARLEKFLLADDLQKHPEYQPLFNKMVTERNIAMTTQVRKFLAEGQQVFIVVGAAHLIGAEGRVERLKRAGIAVTPL